MCRIRVQIEVRQGCLAVMRIIGQFASRQRPGRLAQEPLQPLAEHDPVGRCASAAARTGKPQQRKTRHRGLSQGHGLGRINLAVGLRTQPKGLAKRVAQTQRLPGQVSRERVSGIFPMPAHA